MCINSYCRYYSYKHFKFATSIRYYKSFTLVHIKLQFFLLHILADKKKAFQRPVTTLKAEVFHYYFKNG